MDQSPAKMAEICTHNTGPLPPGQYTREDTHFEIKPAFGAKERCSYLCGMSNNVCISASG